MLWNECAKTFTSFNFHKEGKEEPFLICLLARELQQFREFRHRSCKDCYGIAWIQFSKRILWGLQSFCPGWQYLGVPKTLLFQTWLFAMFTRKRSFALFCALFALFCARPRLERPRLGTSEILNRVAQEPNRNRKPELSEPLFPKPKAEPEPPEPFSRNRNRNRNRPFLLNCSEIQKKKKKTFLGEEPPKPKTGTAWTVPSPNRNRTEPNRELQTDLIGNNFQIRFRECCFREEIGWVQSCSRRALHQPPVIWVPTPPPFAPKVETKSGMSSWGQMRPEGSRKRVKIDLGVKQWKPFMSQLKGNNANECKWAQN